MKDVPEWSKNLRQHWADNNMPHPATVSERLDRAEKYLAIGAGIREQQEYVKKLERRLELQDAERERARQGYAALTKTQRENFLTKKEPAYTWAEFLPIVFDKWFFVYLSLFLALALFIL